ncbi:MAG: aminotransferase [Betaproteobacteria bacterium RIFCSPLOWO2_12_FULL_62_13]|nr:MAG: aminotransferase [Betaproteobacteria bacterium RIFCSPLOWO2_12_FULL_62_13]
MFSGFLDLPWWGYIAYTLIVTHITIAAVTVFLHRHQAHRALDLHPLPSHFFRFWLWLTTGMVTKEWAAIHRKHHAKCETPEDPHSPQIVGINKVLWEGTELYRKESRNAETIEKYGRGTPDDWIERNLYTRYSVLGVSLLLILNFALFGFIGITVWAVQMLWIPFFAAGVINGIGHFWGYRNFQPEDASTNIVPWGILIGGEELHNNHHAYASSARLSNRWYEFDIGWLYIRTLETLGLAQVKKVAPKLRLDHAKTHCDAVTLQAVVTHRYDVLAKYAKSLRRTCAHEMRALKARAVRVDRAALRRWLRIDPRALPVTERARMDEVLGASKVLNTVYTMRQELAALWQRSSASKEQLVHQLEDWCRRAEESGIEALQEFSRRLRCYA